MIKLNYSQKSEGDKFFFEVLAPTIISFDTFSTAISILYHTNNLTATSPNQILDQLRLIDHVHGCGDRLNSDGSTYLLPIILVGQDVGRSAPDNLRLNRLCRTAKIIVTFW